MRIGREFQLLVSPRASVAAHVPGGRLNTEAIEAAEAFLLLVPTAPGIKPPPDPVGS